MAISDELTRIQTAKADIKSAIEAKGVTVPSSALIDEYDTYIAQISGGGSSDLRDLIEKDITSVDIPDGTTKIGSYIFINCESLASVTIPNTVTIIENDAFNSCYSLTSINIPNSVTSIGNESFRFCTGLTSVTIGNSVNIIGASAFYGCSSLTEITIPSSITSISQQAFQSCSSLTSITIEATTPPYLGTNAFNNTNNCPIYVPAESVETYKAASGWSDYASRIQAIPFFLTTTYNIVDTVNPTKLLYGSSVISSFTSMVIDGVLQSSVVDTYTFDTTGEHTVKYALADPTQIGSSVFRDCTSLTSVTIPNGVTSIGHYAFQGCTGLTSITIPDSVTSIGSNAFYNCTSLTSITLPSNITSNNIGESCFNNCSNITSITIPNGVTDIRKMTFAGCTRLASVTLSTGLIYIRSNAFARCSTLTSITIPSSITSIGNNAFDDCTSLASVTVEATTPPTLYDTPFDNNASGRKIYVPSASVSAYQAASSWSTYASDIEAIPTT